VPVHEEPRHRLVHESPGLRLLDIHIPPGDVTQFHLHDQPTVYVTVKDAYVATQRPGEDWERRSQLRALGEVTDRCDYFTDPLVHRVRNEGTDLFHLIAVVNTDAGEHGLVTVPNTELANRWFVVRRWDVALEERPATTTRVFINAASESWLVVPSGQPIGRLEDGPIVEIQVGRSS
jgi:hypothetical protein